ncbi:hypothetical protein EV702DRAFT_1079167 [Suillus placidus]|uniref:Uncharacterized protein n=1 Tax=Suillus placidus TaxID=48579 RepID=A0A9P7A1I4_9AGAM|nr:hypothetical protein EV702DRAFT_1079167 [Suillus placidus]
MTLNMVYCLSFVASVLRFFESSGTGSLLSCSWLLDTIQWSLAQDDIAMQDMLTLTSCSNFITITRFTPHPRLVFHENNHMYACSTLLFDV